jgi:hypothetical protein
LSFDIFADTWTAIDGLGRKLPDWQECGPPRKNRWVGIFYFIANNKVYTDGPYDVSKIINEKPTDPDFVPGKAHYWGEPETGYYLSSDRWVIRKHAYMLSDAGVDTLIFDVTNDVTFPQTYTAVCEVFEKVRLEGERTPQICFLASEESIRQLWEDLYSPGRFSDLWFQWKGKPLLLFGQWEKRGDMNDVILPQHIQDFFTIRKSWAWDSLSWYGEGGYHRWPWVAHYPQCVGWDQPGVAEMVPVAIGQHPLSNIGRSFHDGHQPEVDAYDLTPYTGEGLHFSEQWRHALEVDPEFIFITGWNEWTAGCAVCDDPSQEALQAQWDFFPGAILGRAGHTLKKGDRYFIDQYNQEFSRDAEPMRDGHTDNYYYQMVANIRRYKGVHKPPEISKPVTIQFNGDFSQWESVRPEYRDHQFDTMARDEPGANHSVRYRDHSGRNEFVILKAARDNENIYFLAQTRNKLSPATDPNWMWLFLNTHLENEPNWLGYQYLINFQVIDENYTKVMKNTAGWSWQEIGKARFQMDEKQLMISVPRKLVGLDKTPLSFEFHWSDNLQQPGDLNDFLTSGDSAPNRRFNYIYQE